MIMKNRILIVFIALFFHWLSYGQQPGDTLVVPVFKYGSTSRDTLLSFPSGNLTYEKIILKYNMRCKNALVSTQSAPNQGCGEWDYSCNTFIVDSTRVEEVLSTHPSHVISNFVGSTFHYTTDQLYDYWQFRQIDVMIDSVVTEFQTVVGVDSIPVPAVLKTDEQSGRSIVLYTAAELIAAGFMAGDIDGMLLHVSNSGGDAHFFNMGMKHTSDSILHPGPFTTTGFTRVYHRSHTFTTGANRIQFHTPFVWDGTSNILIDLSFTNSQPGHGIVLTGHIANTSMVLTANNLWSVDLSGNGLITLDPAHFGSVQQEISVSFRSLGQPGMLPANTSVLYGWSNTASQRQFNIHHPWGNEHVYFDCGFSGGFDRINKIATMAEYAGNWGHWVFTKHASTGNMSIYLNGALWHSGTGKTNLIDLQQMILGNNHAGNANYKGRVQELSIWNKALSASEVTAWYNRSIDSTHSSYNHLLSYYPMREGAGNNLVEVRHNLSATGNDFHWHYERGHNIDGMFAISNLRPNITLLRGNYLLDTITVIVTDSVPRNPATVKEYSIVQAPQGSLQHDQVSLVSTSLYHPATPIYLYDGDYNTQIATIPVTPDDSIQITTLNYLRRFPFYVEILSFVTPYGKGLDLGVEGKTWYFDLTDFTPLLQGNKRLMMTGGVWQEELDIDFLFIVGSPPRDVLEFRELWQGSARAGQASIAAINSDVRFWPTRVPLHPQGDHFKVRATITGHGAQGEFHQNGGTIPHFFTANHANNKATWTITRDCSMNPVFPQGGTWVYDRQGWCPGEPSFTKEINITPWVTPGDSALLDYGCGSPQSSGGDYRYLVAMQLVTYGQMNHNLDAAIEDVVKPSDKVLHSRKNPPCGSPVVLVKNTGATAITSVEIEYWLNNATTKQSHTWTGNLASMASSTIELPSNNLWLHGYQHQDNVFHAEITRINGTPDDYSLNNTFASPFTVAEKIPQQFVVEFRTNNMPQHNSYKIIDETGATMPGASNLTAANTFYRDTFNLDGCYTLVVTDLGKDGLQWWANPSQGSGFVRLKRTNGTLLKQFQSDFGGGFEYSFTTLSPTGIEKPEQAETYTLYPNPAGDLFYLVGPNLQNARITLTDLTGRTAQSFVTYQNSSVIVHTNHLPHGIYLLIIETATQRSVKRVVLE
jgi:hypothetical protein